jgi:hypothetical protein
VVDRRGQLRLPQEPVAERRVLGEVRGEELERDPPLEAQVLGQVDDAHPAEAEQRLDPLAVELGADPPVVRHVHVRILAFGGLEERYDDSSVVVRIRPFRSVSGQ